MPKNNPWADKEYLSWLIKAYPHLMHRASYKLKETFITHLQVKIIEKDVVLAQES